MSPAHPIGPPTIAQTPHRHVFVMLGEETLFLYHQTMLHQELHAFQLVIEARLPPDEMAKYREIRKMQSASGLLFFANTDEDRFALPDLHNGRTTTFVGNIYTTFPKEPSADLVHPGNYPWPWKDDRTALVTNMRMDVVRSVYFRRFDAGMGRPQHLTYLLFGKKQEAHVCHLQIAPPDFDHVASLTRAPDWLPPTLLEAGVSVNFPLLDDRPARTADPLASKKTHVVWYSGIPEAHAIEVERTWWFETWVTNPFTLGDDGGGHHHHRPGGSS